MSGDGRPARSTRYREKKEFDLPNLIARPRVEEYLRSAVALHALTLVQAPLGVGKTAALQSVLRARPEVAWMDAKPWHRGAFTEAIVAAARAVRPDFGRVTLGAVGAGADADHLALTFAEELTHVDDPLVLVLDDAQIFADDPQFVRFFTRVFAAIPVRMRIVMSGRALPEMALGELHARREIAYLDTELFRFDEDEIRALGQVMGYPVDADRARELNASTNGWAAGIVLGLSAPAFSTVGATRSAAAAYLNEQLLPSLPDDLVAFLEETAVFETLDLRVLECSETFSTARRQIEGLRRGGALVSELPGDRFRVHPVLRELAAARLEARGGTRRAHGAATRAYAGAGELRAALFHAAVARDPVTAADFLREHADAVSATADHDRVREIVATIDPGGRDGDVRWYVEALIEKALGSNEVRETFVRAAQAADRLGRPSVAFNARAQMLEYDLAHLRTGTSAAIQDVGERAVALGLHSVARATMLRGWAYAVEHDFRAALATIAPLADRGDAVARFNTAVLQAYVQTALGSFEAAEETLDALVRLLENDDRVVLQTLALIWLARLSLTWGNTNVAADAAFGAERLARALDLHANEAGLYVALSEVASHLGDIDSTVRYAEHARRRADFAWYAADVERVRAFAQIALARAAFLGHENAIARQLALRAAAGPQVPSAQRAVLLAEGAVYTLLCEPSAAGAAIAAARSALTTAIAIDASDAVAIATSGEIIAFLLSANGETFTTELAGSTSFRALIEQRRGLVTLELAGVAVGNARRGTGSTAAFDAALAALCQHGPRFEVRLARAYASRFIKAERTPPQPAPQLTDLTPREVEILRLLVDGLTNKEIAQRLVVSPRTVETHVERVLSKLDVRSRSRAIAKAIRLGIVRFDDALV